MTFFNQSLGIRGGDDGASVVLDAGPEHLVAPDTVHFAVLATLAEVAAAGAAGNQGTVPVVPAAVSVQLIARARPGRLVGRGRLLRRGKRLAFAEGEVSQEGEVVAKATVTFAVL